MLIAPTGNAAPFDVEVMGATFTFTPITRAMLLRARRAGQEAVGADGDVIDEFGSAISHALLMEGMTGWSGVALPIGEDEPDDGAIEVDGALYRMLACTPENKALLLSDAVIFEALDLAYVMPFVTRERAKNAPAGSSDGTSPRVTPEKTIVGKPAAAKRGAKRAPTASTRSRTLKSKSRSTR